MSSEILVSQHVILVGACVVDCRCGLSGRCGRAGNMFHTRFVALACDCGCLCGLGGLCRPMVKACSVASCSGPNGPCQWRRVFLGPEPRRGHCGLGCHGGPQMRRLPRRAGRPCAIPAGAVADATESRACRASRARVALQLFRFQPPSLLDDRRTRRLPRRSASTECEPFRIPAAPQAAPKYCACCARRLHFRLASPGRRATPRR